MKSKDYEELEDLRLAYNSLEYLTDDDRISQIMAIMNRTFKDFMDKIKVDFKKKE